MFQSFSFKYLGYDEDNKEHRYQITIVDDEFMETAPSKRAFSPPVGNGGASVRAAADAVIEIYSRRNLNVAKNLWLLHEHCNQHYGRWNERIAFWQKHIPEYAPYHNDVLYYLTFT